MQTCDDLEFVCPEGSFRCCVRCVYQNQGPECPLCGQEYNNERNPHQIILSKQIGRAGRRPLIVCSICHEIQSQAGFFMICEGCTANGGRTVFCSQCVHHGHHNLHLDLCRSRKSDAILREVAVNLDPCAKYSDFCCLSCHISTFLILNGSLRWRRTPQAPKRREKYSQQS